MIKAILVLLILAAPCSAEPWLELVGYCPHVTDGDTLTWEVSFIPKETSGRLSLYLVGATVDEQPFLRLANAKKSEAHQVQFPVRLLDYTDRANPRGVWAKEKSERGGNLSQENLARMAKGQAGTLIVDLGRAFASRGDHKDTAYLPRLGHMNRWFGDISIAGFKTTIGRRQINAGYAYPTKLELLESE